MGAELEFHKMNQMNNEQPQNETESDAFLQQYTAQMTLSPPQNEKGGCFSCCKKEKGLSIYYGLNMDERRRLLSKPSVEAKIVSQLFQDSILKQPLSLKPTTFTEDT